MESAALVAIALLVGAQLAEVFRRLGHHICAKKHHDAPGIVAAYSYIEEHLWVAFLGLFNDGGSCGRCLCFLFLRAALRLQCGTRMLLQPVVIRPNGLETVFLHAHRLGQINTYCTAAQLRVILKEME